jgi:hypothetical protein
MAPDAYQHMEDVFGHDGNPFPGEAVNTEGEIKHYSDRVFPEETEQFRSKTIRGALQGNRKMMFLWSRSPSGDDTGYGKTALMRATVQAMNADFGHQLQTEVGVKPARVRKIAGAFTKLDEQSQNGLYPILHAATMDMAGPDGVLDQARAELFKQAGGDPDAVWEIVADKLLEIAPTGQQLRPDFMHAFLESPQALASFLSEVSDASRVRNGIQYFTAALYVLVAAGVDKLFLMVDQMEDLGKKGTLTAAKRRREIGRIRDLLEIEPFATYLHTSFTFHTAAAMTLEGDWEANRLPSFDYGHSNSAAVVIHRGLRDDEQVSRLLEAWMADTRNDHAGSSPISPFADDVREVLRAVSNGRAGILLNRANELFYAGAEAGLDVIDADFARTHFNGAGHDVTVSGVGVGYDEGDDDDDGYDAMLT